jgi:hypothetical protein
MDETRRGELFLSAPKVPAGMRRSVARRTPRRSRSVASAGQPHGPVVVGLEQSLGSKLSQES